MHFRIFFILLISLAFPCHGQAAQALASDTLGLCDRLLSQNSTANEQAWFKRSLEAVEGLSAHMAQHKPFASPLLILTRGNSGSGKTFILQNGQHPLLNALQLKPYFAAAGEDGIVNPDTIKNWIQESDGRSSQEVHEEGSAIAKEVIAQALNLKLNLIVDKRFLTLDSIRGPVEQAKSRGYRVVVLDVDAPLDTSILRIGSRVIGGGSPSVPFKPIEEGFVEARKNRADFAKEPMIDEYYLFGSGKLVAQRSAPGPLQIVDSVQWKVMTETPDPHQLVTIENLYRSLLDFLSQTMPGSIMQPYNVGLAQSPVQAEPSSMPAPEQGAVEYFFYQIYKTGDMQAHEKLGMTVAKYLHRVYPKLRIHTDFVPEGPERQADYRITVSSDDSDLMRRLLHDSFWKPTAEVDHRGNVILTYSTRRIGKRPAGVFYVEYDDLKAYLPGEAPADVALAAKHFVLFGVKLGSLPEMPPDVRVQMFQRIRFHAPFADAHHNGGFHVKQIAAAVFASQVEHYQFKKGASTSQRVCEQTQEAQEYIFCVMAVQQGVAGFSFNGTAAETRKIGPWLEKMRSIVDDVRTQAGCS